jgi:hypothetical protein
MKTFVWTLAVFALMSAGRSEASQNAGPVTPQSLPGLHDTFRFAGEQAPFPASPLATVTRALEPLRPMDLDEGLKASRYAEQAFRSA